MSCDRDIPSTADSNQDKSLCKKSKTGRYIKTGRYMFTVFGLGCFFGLLYFGGFGAFDKIVHPNYSWLIAAISGVGVMVFIFAIRWGGLVNCLAGRRVTDNITYFFYSLSSLAIGLIVPHAVGTTVSKAAALNTLENVSWKKSGVSILLDKMFDAFFMVMFSWPLFFLVIGKATVSQVALISLIEFIFLTLLIVVNYSYLIRILQLFVLLAMKGVELVPFFKKHSQLQNIEAIYNLREWDVLQRKIVLRAYFLTALGQIMLAARAWLAAMAIGVNVISPLDAFVGIGLVQASVLISFTPGALGFSDAAWFIALAAAGVPKEVISVFIVAFRLIENLAVVVWWVPLYLYRMIRAA